MNSLVLAVRKAIRKHRMLEPGDRVLVAVSGGPDSVALLHALAELRKGLQISLLAAHLDHGLRPGGRKEADFVRGLAGKLGVPFHGGKAEVRSLAREEGLTLQEAAREARYAFLARTAGRNRATRVALGHTADDQAETVVMRFLRGAGSRGLAGIPPVRDGFYIRPLIETWREDVESYLRRKKIPFLADPSNESPDYLRNRVRHELLPLLARYNPGVRRVLAQTAELFRAEEKFWQEYTAENFPRVVRGRSKERLVLDVRALLAQPLPVRLRLLRHAVEEVQGDLRRVHLSHVRALHALLEERGPNRSLRLPRGLIASRAYGALTFSRSREETFPFEHAVPGPGYVEIPEIGRTVSFEARTRKGRIAYEESPLVAFLDLDAIDFPLTLRSFKPGDRIQPLGMEGEKKVKDLFMDCKIPAPERKRIPLLFCGDRLLWVAGVRIDHRARLKPQTRRILRAELL